MVKKEKNERKIILNRTLSMPYSENPQFEDGAHVGKMETTKKKSANSCFEEKITTTKEIPSIG